MLELKTLYSIDREHYGAGIWIEAEVRYWYGIWVWSYGYGILGSTLF